MVASHEANRPHRLVFSSSDHLRTTSPTPSGTKANAAERVSCALVFVQGISGPAAPLLGPLTHFGAGRDSVYQPGRSAFSTLQTSTRRRCTPAKCLLPCPFLTEKANRGIAKPSANVCPNVAATPFDQSFSLSGTSFQSLSSTPASWICCRCSKSRSDLDAAQLHSWCPADQ